MTVRTAAWLAYWDQARGLRSFKDHADLYGYLSPFWYEMASATSITAYPNAEATDVVDAARASDVALVATISNNQDGTRVATMLATAANRTAHVNTLRDLAVNKGYDGLDIDYENLPAAERDRYTAFIQELSTALHNAGKQLTVTVHPKTAEPGHWSGAQAQDWAALGAAADRFRIMTYDYSWSTSPPGPIAPVGWVTDVANFAVTLVPRHKIQLGMALYGYDWVGSTGTGVTWSEVQERLATYNAQRQWDVASQSPWFTYTVNGVTHEVWYEDAASARAKLPLVTQLGLSGPVFWRLGGEDPDVWQVVREAFPWRADPWLASMSDDHNIAARADLLWGGQVRVSDLPVTDVSVTEEASAETLRSVRLTMADPGDLVPKNAGSKLAPYGSEIAIYGGRFESGERTLYPGGVFRIDRSSVVHNEGLTVSLAGKDRSVSVDAGGFWVTSTVQPGDNIVDAITAILTKSLPDVPTNFASGTHTAPVLLVWEEGESPWQACRELAASIGMEIFFDPSGTCVLRRVPNAWSTTPVAKYVVGEEKVLSVARDFDAQEGYNRYVVIGQDANRNPVRGVAKDDDPKSVTYYGGPFGKRSHPPIRDEKVGTSAQAEEAARSLLNRDRGGTDEVELELLPDWQRTAGDVVLIQDPLIGLDELAVVEGLTKTHYGLRLRTAAKRTAVEGEAA